MIVTTSEPARYQSRYSNGTHSAFSDTTADKGGGGQGFRPHELLEAALASCMNMHLRMYADNHGIALGNVTTTVVIDRTDAAKATFNYSIEFSEQLSSEQRAKLSQIATTCPVHNTLSREIAFRQEDRLTGGRVTSR